MTPRERFIQTLTFGQPDRVFYSFGLPRKSTMDAWYRQGLPRMPAAGDYDRPGEFLQLGGHDPLRWGLPVNADILPPFETKTIEDSERGRLWQDGHGIIQLDAGDRLNTPGFRTRTFVSHPVRDRESWLRMRERFDPRTPGRYPQDWETKAAALRQRDFPVMAQVPGPYWKARDFIGFENLSVMFYDDPALVHEIMEHVTVFVMEVFERALREVGLDCVILSEDMAYKPAAMISPAMFREFMLPRYKRLVAFFRDRGVPIFMVDCDGYVGELIPLWLEAGANATFPTEIAAGNDPVAYRKLYGKRLAIFGGIDKREIRSKERTYAEVMSRVPFLIEQGGFLPSIDHAVPPDVPLRSYLYMCELIKAIAEGRPVPGPSDPLEIEERLGPIERMWSPADGPDEE